MTFLSMETSLNFGFQPVSNRFYLVDSDRLSPKFPLSVGVDLKTGLIKLEKLFPVEELKPRHDWLTCFEPEDHLDELVEDLIKLPNINNDAVIGAYSFKDDSTIERLNDKGYNNTWRIDPKSDLSVDKFANVETYQQVFTKKKAKIIKERYGAADLLLVRHVIEHAYDISEFVEAISLLVKPNGYIVWELPSCEKYLVNGDCTMIWEEHTHYFTKFTFREFLEKEGFCIDSLNVIPYPLEDCIVAVTRKEHNRNKGILSDRKGVDVEVERAKKYIELLNSNKISIPFKLEEIHNKYGSIVMFGAGHFSVAFISILGIEHLIDFVIDDNSNKKGKKLPGGSIPIVGSDILYQKNIKVCLLGLNPQSHYKIINKHKSFVENGGLFLSIFPGTDQYFEDIL